MKTPATATAPFEQLTKAAAAASRKADDDAKAAGIEMAGLEALVQALLSRGWL